MLQRPYPQISAHTYRASTDEKTDSGRLWTRVWDVEKKEDRNSWSTTDSRERTFSAETVKESITVRGLISFSLLVKAKSNFGKHLAWPPRGTHLSDSFFSLFFILFTGTSMLTRDSVIIPTDTSPSSIVRLFVNSPRVTHCLRRVTGLCQTLSTDSIWNHGGRQL